MISTWPDQSRLPLSSAIQIERLAEIAVGGPGSEGDGVGPVRVGGGGAGEAPLGGAVGEEGVDGQLHGGLGRGAVGGLQVDAHADQVVWLVDVAVGDQQQVEGGAGHGDLRAAAHLAAGGVDHLGGDLVVGVGLGLGGGEGELRAAVGGGGGRPAGDHGVAAVARPPDGGLHGGEDHRANPGVPPAVAGPAADRVGHFGVGDRRAEVGVGADGGGDGVALHVALGVGRYLDLELGLAVLLDPEGRPAHHRAAARASLSSLDLEGVVAQADLVGHVGAAAHAPVVAGLEGADPHAPALRVAQEDAHLLAHRGPVGALGALAQDRLEVHVLAGAVEGAVGLEVGLEGGLGAPGPIPARLDGHVLPAAGHVDEPGHVDVDARAGRDVDVPAPAGVGVDAVGGQAHSVDLQPVWTQDRLQVPLDPQPKVGHQHRLGLGLHAAAALGAGHVDVDARAGRDVDVPAPAGVGVDAVGGQARSVDLQPVWTQDRLQVPLGDAVFAHLDRGGAPEMKGELLARVGGHAAAQVGRVDVLGQRGARQGEQGRREGCGAGGLDHGSSWSSRLLPRTGIP
jgi:hypothetical protein